MELARGCKYSAQNYSNCEENSWKRDHSLGSEAWKCTPTWKFLQNLWFWKCTFAAYQYKVPQKKVGFCFDRLCWGKFNFDIPSTITYTHEWHNKWKSRYMDIGLHRLFTFVPETPFLKRRKTSHRDRTGAIRRRT